MGERKQTLKPQEKQGKPAHQAGPEQELLFGGSRSPVEFR